MYLAPSSFRACTLRFPSVVRMRRLSSLNVNESFTARALRIPRRSRSWMSRLSSGGPTEGARWRGTRAAGRLSAARRTRLRGVRSSSATVPPRDRDAEGDVEAAESGRHERVAPGRGAVERTRAEQHEAESHDRNNGHREKPAGNDSGAVENEPQSRDPVGRSR